MFSPTVRLYDDSYSGKDEGAKMTYDIRTRCQFVPRAETTHLGMRGQGRRGGGDSAKKRKRSSLGSESRVLFSILNRKSDVHVNGPCHACFQSQSHRSKENGSCSQEHFPPCLPITQESKRRKSKQGRVFVFQNNTRQAGWHQWGLHVWNVRN